MRPTESRAPGMASMQNDRPPAMPLQSSGEGQSPSPPSASTDPSQYLTLREAARQAGCSESTLRRLVKSNDVPYVQEETKTGFRYLFEPSTIGVLAHKASMRRPAGRPSGRRVGGSTVQPSTYEALQEASWSPEEIAALRVERELLRAENARLWLQIERLTESVTRLALPPSRTPEPEATSGSPGGESPSKRGFWDWFLGREAKG